MKKTFSKILIITLIAIFITEFVFSNYAFAVGTVEGVVNSLTNVLGGIMSIVYWPKRIMITGIAFVANTVSTALATWSNPSGEGIAFVTPFDIFFNKCEILNVNFFDIPDSPPGEGDPEWIVYTIRVNVTKWFYVMRLLAVAILLVILIYVGIRMAIASVADEKAQYKKMLFDWACSLALVFIIPYIAIFTIYANEAILKALEVAVGGKDDIGSTISDIGVNAVLGIGIDSLTSVAVYAFLVFQIIGYVIAYINRMLKVGFLLIISPLITITYSIDKMGDGKSQALNTWLKEFIYTILIQPFHCIIYITFISVAFKLIIAPSTAVMDGLASGSLKDTVLATAEYNQLASGILAIICVKFIKDAEKMVRTIFNFKDHNDGLSLAAGLAVTGAIMSKTKNGVQSAKNFVGGAKKFGVNLKNNNFAKAIGKDLKGSKAFNAMSKKVNSLKDNIKKSDAAKSLGNMKKGLIDKKNDFTNKINKVSDKFRKSAGGQKAISRFKSAKALGSKVWNSKAANFMKKRNSLSSALGITAGLAAYALTDTGAMGAIGTGNLAYQSADKFLSATARTTGNENGADLEQKSKGKREQIQANNAKIEEREAEVKDIEKQMDEVDAEMDTTKSQIDDSQERIQEYKDSGNYDLEAGERAHRSELVSKMSDLKERKAELEAKKVEKTEEHAEEIAILEEENRQLQAELDKLETPDGTKEEMERIIKNGKDGMYSKGSEAYDEAIEPILREIRTALEGAGKADLMDAMMASMKKELSANSGSFDMTRTLERCLGSDITSAPNFDKVKSSVEALKDFELDANMFRRAVMTSQMNFSLEKMVEQTHNSYMKK